jgi:predicted nucleotidyltransferase component of viral defense system
VYAGGSPSIKSYYYAFGVASVEWTDGNHIPTNVKGGTCLIKCYYGYIRFLEDIDLESRGDFEGKSQKKVKEILSEKIEETGIVFERVATRRGLEFKIDKVNKRYV